MYQKIKDEIENSFNVEILFNDNENDEIFLYSKKYDINDEILQSINSSIEKYNCSFKQENPKMASLVKHE